MVRYLPVSSAITVLLYFLGIASAGLVCAEITTVDKAIKPIVIGKADAPVTIIEYASLGCSHCAQFHQKIYPKLKKTYIDTGKVKLIFTDFPLNTPALAASMIARCAGPTRYLGFVDLFFQAQEQWNRADNPLEALKKIARFGGLSSEDVVQCLNQQPLIDYIQETARKANSEHKINSTPSFIINGKKVTGAIDYEKFRSIIDEALKLAKQP